MPVRDFGATKCEATASTHQVDILGTLSRMGMVEHLTGRILAGLDWADLKTCEEVSATWGEVAGRRRNEIELKVRI